VKELPEISHLRERDEHLIALTGNPNVGKSTLFNRLTGMGVLTANYPGMTVGFNLGETSLGDEKLGVIDLPGTYALGAVSEDQLVARRGILEASPDVVAVILDATNLVRNLYLLLQVLDLEVPVVVALNLVDEAERHGIHTDPRQLSEILGVPVVPTVATRGDGLDELVRAILDLIHEHKEFYPIPFYYANDIEGRIREIAAEIGRSRMEIPYGIPPRALSLLLLEQDGEFMGLLEEDEAAAGTLALVERAREEMQRSHGNDAALVIARERYGIAGSIVEAVQERRERGKLSWGERLWEYTTSPKTGIPILLVVLALTFLTLFLVGDLLSRALSDIWNTLVTTPLQNALDFVPGAPGQGVFATLVMWVLAYGMEAALSVAIPYVLVFFIILAVLEDTGYLNSVAFLTDRVMHRFGLHGRAMIPLISAAGCNVPAIMGTRVLSTRRERIIASTLIMLVPCSAITAVIIGGVGRYAGWGYAVLVYAVLFLLMVAAGLGLNRLLPGESSGLVMEVFPYRRPSARTVLVKTWFRFKEFIYIAVPFMLGGSLLLGLLVALGWLDKLEGPLRPVMQGWLGLPAVAGLALVFGFVRKEMALQMLLLFATGAATGELSGFMTSQQIFIFGLVTAIYIPCLATFAVLWKEMGWRVTLSVSAFTILLALAAGGAANLVFQLL
jgi:ferrous iron transport protein B